MIKRSGVDMSQSLQPSDDLRIANDTAGRLARNDELTGMKNRRAFYELAPQAFEQAQRYDRPPTLISIDIDHFKRISDTWGFGAGDATLRAQPPGNPVVPYVRIYKKHALQWRLRMHVNRG